MFATLRRTLKSHSQAHAERGVITMAETLIVLGVAAFAVMIWATTKLSQLDAEAAQLAGRNIAAYSRAAAEWLTENPLPRMAALPSLLCRIAQTRPERGFYRAVSAPTRSSLMCSTPPATPLHSTI